MSRDQHIEAVSTAITSSLDKSHGCSRSAPGSRTQRAPSLLFSLSVGMDDVTDATIRNISPGLGLREACGIDSAVRWVIVRLIELGCTQWLCCQQECSKPCQMVIAISSGSARVVGHHSPAAEDCEARSQWHWHWQTETYAALATIRSWKCGIDVDALMARRERNHRRK